MKHAKWLLHPVFIFVFSILALGLSLFLYIYWFVEVSIGLQGVIRRFDLDPGQFFDIQTWVVIVVLSVLVGIILVGIFFIFVYNVKTLQLYRMQRNFINSFTHELKTPATSMQLYLETFKKYDLPREMQLKYIQYMLADVDRLTSNINRILNLAKLEGKIYEGNLIIIDLEKAINNFLLKNSQLSRECIIRIHTPGNASFTCPVYLPLFEMLLMNLVTNSIKYNETAMAEINVFFKQGNRELHLIFSDNGIGFDRSEAKKIFKKFYQIEGASKTQDEGSGLGLYMVANIARLHKWRVKAKSMGTGLGAQFIIIIPNKQRAGDF